MESVGHLARGIYRVRRRKLRGPALHYGVLSVGVLDPGVVEVIDLDRTGFGRWDLGEWAHGRDVEVVGQCPDDEIPTAIERLREAITGGGGYRLWKNNCEHFATWVVAGVHKSAQVEGAADVAVVVGVAALAVGGIALLIRATRKG